MDKFDAMQTFVRIIEKGSFSAVARERGIGQPAVSKQISALEDELGTELLLRASRSIALTDAGRDFYESAILILEDFESSTSRIGRGPSAPAMTQSVSSPRESFAPAISNSCGWASSSIWELRRRRRGSSPRSSGKVSSSAF